MKRIFVALLAVSLTTGAFAQTKVVGAKESTIGSVNSAKPKKADDVVKFAELKHDFGKIKQGVPVNYDFSFENVGAQPIVIESATASCGCTTPTWPKTPVTKNKAEKISAGYNAANLGQFEKVITVKVAGYDLPLELTIKGEVLSTADYAKFETAKGKKNSK